ncbi:MAG: hypothetical protein JO352_35915 [Chloroflexi bacterium]|nr:hypothetical protein [Chloroflexota bacterium]MBV9598826.1 hypothetical protein [Chloroflexota bacterium]
MSQPGDDELLAAVEAARWHRSPGYMRKDGEWVEPHEYILTHEEPDLVARLRRRLNGPGTWRAAYKGYTWRYVRLGDWRYWGEWGEVFNRTRMVDD